jgi:effector-binding domain-containing protein
MNSPPEVVESPRQLAAVVHVTVPKPEISSAMGPAIHEVLDALKDQGMEPAGPPFSHHMRLDPEVWDFEVGFPTERPVEPVGRVKVGELPEARVIRTIYQGPYEGLGSAWGEFQAWIEAEGVDVGPNFWERYVAGPESGPDPADYKTELNRTLAG